MGHPLVLGAVAAHPTIPRGVHAFYRFLSSTGQDIAANGTDWQVFLVPGSHNSGFVENTGSSIVSERNSREGHSCDLRPQLSLVLLVGLR